MSTELRGMARTIEPELTSDGAGVKLRRSIATRGLDNLDPFLLFDHFGSDDPDDYIRGFPMHPHRGIETVTYMLSGAMLHRDSLGNEGVIEGGDVQWMTAGRGILHEEMPQLREGRMEGFQLWVNLPSRLKMTAPRYQEIRSRLIPRMVLEDGIRVRVIAGAVGRTRGTVTEIAAEPTYLDVSIPPGGVFRHPVPRGQAAFAYVFEGKALFSLGGPVAAPRLVVFGDGDMVKVTTENGTRLLLVSGKPFGEPIVRYGPVVMNTREQIQKAMQDLQKGTFIQKRRG